MRHFSIKFKRNSFLELKRSFCLDHFNILDKGVEIQIVQDIERIRFFGHQCDCHGRIFPLDQIDGLHARVAFKIERFRAAREYAAGHRGERSPSDRDARNFGQYSEPRW